MSGDRCLIVFAKPARAGRVKTRLIGALSAEQAAELQAAFLADLLAGVSGGAFAVRIAWGLEDGEALPGPGVRQEGADLGERLYRALATAAREFDIVAAAGSDHPELGRGAVEAAFDAVTQGADVALGPAADGGYYLIAGRLGTLLSELFTGIPWSSGEVLARTVERCRALALRTVLLPVAADVDTPADLEELVARLAAQPGRCPASRRLLRAWGFAVEPAREVTA